MGKGLAERRAPVDKRIFTAGVAFQVTHAPFPGRGLRQFLAGSRFRSPTPPPPSSLSRDEGVSPLPQPLPRPGKGLNGPGRQSTAEALTTLSQREGIVGSAV